MTVPHRVSYGKEAEVECTHFPSALFAIFYTSLALIGIYCGYKCVGKKVKLAADIINHSTLYFS
jgi:hypothetical protein